MNTVWSGRSGRPSQETWFLLLWLMVSLEKSHDPSCTFPFKSNGLHITYIPLSLRNVSIDVYMSKYCSAKILTVVCIFINWNKNAVIEKFFPWRIFMAPNFRAAHFLRSHHLLLKQIKRLPSGQRLRLWTPNTGDRFHPWFENKIHILQLRPGTAK